MATDKELLKLTDYQQQLVDEFLAAAKRMKNAGVYSFSDHHTGSIYFVNNLNVKSFWIGENEADAPFDNDGCSVEQHEIHGCGGNVVGFTEVFDNYAFPDDLLCYELNDEEQ